MLSAVFTAVAVATMVAVGAGVGIDARKELVQRPNARREQLRWLAASVAYCLAIVTVATLLHHGLSAWAGVAGLLAAVGSVAGWLLVDRNERRSANALLTMLAEVEPWMTPDEVASFRCRLMALIHAHKALAPDPKARPTGTSHPELHADLVDEVAAAYALAEERKRRAA